MKKKIRGRRSIGSTIQRQEFDSVGFRNRLREDILKRQNIRYQKRIDEQKPFMTKNQFKKIKQEKQYHLNICQGNTKKKIEKKQERETQKPIEKDVEQYSNVVLKEEYEKQKIIDNVKIILTLKMGENTSGQENNWNIIAALPESEVPSEGQNLSYIKIIKIQQRKLKKFIAQYCSGESDNIFQCLRYDKIEQVLYLVVPERGFKGSDYYSQEDQQDPKENFQQEEQLNQAKSDK